HLPQDPLISLLPEEDNERKLNYNPPAQKSLQEIQEMDKDDESLVKYKQTLLGPEAKNTDLSGPNVRVTRLALLCDDAPEPITMDLTGTALEEKSFTLQEGVKYRLKVYFKVGWIKSIFLYHLFCILPLPPESSMVCMMGSYGPRAEEQEFLCPADETPKGLMSRGQYQIKSCFVDDDKNAYLSWGWNINISKEWN
uniref:Rho GDP dissociation inhibitor (GDI) gamma n=1 Tax=Nothobranchius furzeri TaxID=105023 RepID=A0A8C6KI47_NOTFU